MSSEPPELTLAHSEWFVYLSVPQHDKMDVGGYIWGPFRGKGGEPQARQFISMRGGILLGPYREKERKVPKTLYSGELAEQWMLALTDAASLKSELTNWERQFLESIADQYDRRGSLSPKQFEILEKIYAEKTR